MSYDHISPARLLDPPDQGQGQLALDLSTGSCMHEEIFVSCSLNWVARRAVSQHGPQMGLNVLKGRLSWGQTTDAGAGGREVRSLQCVHRLCFPFVQKLVEEGHVHTFKVGGRGITGREAPVSTHTDTRMLGSAARG